MQLGVFMNKLWILALGALALCPTCTFAQIPPPTFEPTQPADGPVLRDCCECPCPAPQRLWADSEFLLWWINKAPVPAPLLTQALVNPAVAEKNLKKHGVSFDDAAFVLADEDGDKFHVEEYDREHSTGEDRYVTTASHPGDRSIVLIIAWTDRSTEHAKITRIISARAAKPAERPRYAKEISGQ